MRGRSMIAVTLSVGMLGGLFASVPLPAEEIRNVDLPAPKQARRQVTTASAYRGHIDPLKKPGTFKQKARQTAKARAHKRHRRMKHGVR